MIGFPLTAKTRYYPVVAKGARAPTWPIAAGMALHAKRAIGRAKFRAYMLQTLP
jgi:hypothetical protein